MKRAALVVLIAVCAGCPSTLPKYNYAAEPDPRKKELVLGVGDVVGINVWENGNLNTDATIRPDGTITMPLVGDLKAAGETPSSLRSQIATKLAAYVRLQDTAVTVAVKNWKSYRFTIAGEVQRTGVFTSDEYLTVSEALAMAGGLTRFAHRDHIELIRRDPKTGDVKKIPFDYELLASGKRPDMNIYVLSGDALWIP